jgi:lipopolysaccharide export system permease protein
MTTQPKSLGTKPGSKTRAPRFLFQLWQRLPLLDRYIWATLCPPYLFALGLFSGLTISFGALFEVLNDLVETPIPLAIVGQLFVLQLPYCIGLAMPLALLLATLIGWGKLTASSEITALTSVGVSVYRMLLPVIGFGLCVSSFAFTINETVVPLCRDRANTLIQQVVEAGLSNNQVQNIFFPQYDDQGNINRLFFANRLEGSQLQGLTLLDFSQEGVEQVITAATAAWNQTSNTWSLADGTIYFVDSSTPAAAVPQGETSEDPHQLSGNVMQFGQQELQLPRKATDAPPDKEIEAMSLPEAQQTLQRLQSGADPSTQRRQRRLAIQIQQRFAVPFQGVILAMMGTALTLGNRRARSSSGRGFGWSFLVLMGQYLLLFITTGLGINGVLAPWLAAWLPSFVGVGLTVYWLRSRR